MRRSTTQLANLALIALGLVVALAIAEGLVRVFAPHVRDHVIPGRMFEIDDQLGWRLRPGVRATHATTLFEVDYRINAAGFRDRDRAKAKPPGTRRILLFGDSQAFGWGMPDAARYSNLIESRGEGIEVVNLGVPGYGLDQEILAYERLAGAWEADEAVLTVSTFTLGRLPFARIYRKEKPRFVIGADGALKLESVEPGSSAWTGFLYAAFGPWYLPYFVESALNAAGGATAAPAQAGPAVPASQRYAPGPLERAMIGRAAAFAESRDQRLTLLVDFAPSLESVRQQYREICAALRVRCIETSLPKERERVALGPRDPHWNAYAHSMVAEQLLAQLVERDAAVAGESLPRR